MKKKEKTIADFVQTLTDSASALQDKLIQAIPEYKKMPLAQKMTTQKDEQVYKNNPAMQEFRGIVRDYAYVVKMLREFGNGNVEVDETSVEKLRRRFKVVGE